MSKVDIEIKASRVNVVPGNTANVEVVAEDVLLSEILEQIDAKEAVEEYGEDTLLDLIGKDKAMEYFGLEETD